MLDVRDLSEKRFWALPVQTVAEALETELTHGLTAEEAAERASVFGKNTIESSKRVPGLKILASQLMSPLILILILAGIITVEIAHYRDAAFIFVAVVVNSILGFYQENKAERALSELKTYLKQRTRVIRGGKEREIAAEDVVPGDLIRLAQGDRVPADARVVFVNDVQIDEAVLTGESLPSSKSTDVSSEHAALGDQASMIFAGTLVTQGICVAIVCRTGARTEFGNIAASIAATTNEKTPLQKAIGRFSLGLSGILGALTVAIFVIGISVGEPVLDMFLTAVAIAVSAIPEGLPIAMTVILAIGVERMAKRKGVVRKLVAAEALGSTTVILTDKTGTLTMANMVLSQILPRMSTADALLSQALSNTSVLVENPEESPESWRMNGRIMEVALVRAAAQRGMPPAEILDKRQILQTMPFNAVQKFSAAIIQQGSKREIVLLGAPDVLLAHTALMQAEREDILQTINAHATSGERVLGVASKSLAHTGNFTLSKDLALNQLSFEGLITFRDPLRPGIRHAVDRLNRAGIRTVIMTGDHRGTAMAVAREIGMELEEDSVLDAAEIANATEAALIERLPRLKVISRVTPHDKFRIAQLFQRSGEIVAMTGDGVNDAPSIKQADVGIAMGSGTEVAQSVADLVLLDDNFETIVAAIEEGRQILGNIRKVLVYLLSNVADGLILIGGALVTGLPLPLNALQILWVNFFSDSFPAVAFAFERDADSLSLKPVKKLQLFNPLMKFLILVIGISTSALLFVVYFVLLRLGHDLALVQTFTFAAFGTYTLLVALSVRSLDKSIFAYRLFSNTYLTFGIMFGLVLMAAAVYVPALQTLFGTVALPLHWIAGVVLIGVINIALIEIAKRFFRGAPAR